MSRRFSRRIPGIRRLVFTGALLLAGVLASLYQLTFKDGGWEDVRLVAVIVGVVWVGVLVLDAVEGFMKSRKSMEWQQMDREPDANPNELIGLKYIVHEFKRMEGIFQNQIGALVEADDRDGIDALYRRVSDRPQDWRQYQEKMLHEAEGEGDPLKIAHRHRSLAEELLDEKLYERSEEHASRALEQYVELGNAEFVTQSRMILWRIACSTGNHTLADERFRELKESLFELEADSRRFWLEDEIEEHLGTLYLERGLYAEAQSSFEQVHSYHRDKKQQHLYGDDLANLARVAMKRGDYVEAERLFREAVTAEENPSEGGVGIVIHEYRAYADLCRRRIEETVTTSD